MELPDRLVSNEIRLLTLLPGKWPDPVYCEWSIASLNAKPKYQALSYVWGRSKHLQPIYLNGSPIHITKHLRRALLQLRGDHEAVCLWVDAVCINQWDDKEKTEQVKMMGRIYAQSQEVVVYLGDAFAPSFSESFNSPSDMGDDVSHTMTPQQCYSMSTFNGVDTGLVWRRRMSYRDGSYLFCFIQLLADGVDMNSFITGKDRDSLDKVMEALRLFLSAVQWWKRVWVIQEVVTPRRIMILYGSMIAPWETFVKAADRLHDNPQMEIPSFATDDTKILAEFSRRIRSIESIRNRWQSAEQITLLQLLRQFSGREATDPRDKVYALLGLAKDKPSVEPNYAAQELDVFVDTALDIVSRSGSLDVLTGDFTMKSNHALPSWIPDWSSPLESLIHSRVENVKHYTACKNSTIYVQSERSTTQDAVYKYIFRLYGSQGEYNRSKDAIGNWIDFNWPSLASSHWAKVLAGYTHVGNVGRPKYLEIIEKYYSTRGGPGFLRHHTQGVVSLPGLLIDRVIAIGETMWSGSVLIPTISSWLALITENLSPLEQMISHEDFQSTMCADLMLDAATGQCRRLTSRDRELIGSWLAREVPNYTSESLRRPFRPMNDNPDLSARISNSNAIRSSIMQAIYRRRFFVTAHGRIGLGPAGTRDGDTVCIFPGGRTPFIIRRRPTEDTRLEQRQNRYPYVNLAPSAYEILGDCYVHGLMDGAAMHIWEDVGSNHGRFMAHLQGRPYVQSSRFQNMCEDLKEATTWWGRQASDWYQSAMAWQSAYRAYGSQLINRDLSCGRYFKGWRARRYVDNLPGDWARIEDTWQQCQSAYLELCCSRDSEHFFDRYSAHLKWYDLMQSLRSNISTWNRTKSGLQNFLGFWEKEIHDGTEAEKSLIDWSFKNISRRYRFVERLMPDRLRTAEHSHMDECPLSHMTRHDWKGATQEWLRFADQDWELVRSWMVRTDALEEVRVTEGIIGRVLHGLAQGKAHIPVRDFYTIINEWIDQIRELELEVQKIKEEGLLHCKEAADIAENALQTHQPIEEYLMEMTSFLERRRGWEAFVEEDLGYSLGISVSVVYLF
ncbi:heterokaryon incompatibility protein-domain-containing protein [Aspergillus bertholletiae]|uniref:Heterokaryon incompatibility protein-domain-containing protein n=1 Tax=Aspergillus bertholletiae TaxID=1226010 RepID=A0A5N7B6D6_9EURO|nr:heterokaryon incompatibility protein-domain-containing protein [Aspergillus bertholletiae]